MVYFHGNAEDIGSSYDFILKMTIAFGCSVLAVEYPGYGLYQQESSSAETIMQNADLVLEFLTQQIGYSNQDIILVGRSMGSGPATYLASKNKVSSLVLVSPYTSLKAATRSYLGGIASVFVRERFDNLAVIPKVQCPTLIIHGQRDDLIPGSHAIELHRACGGPCKLIMPEQMTHNDFDI